MKRNLSSPIAAFTLIELLTVIAIVSVLTAILIPALGKVRNSANMTKTSQHMRQLHNALSLYVGDNKGYLPKGDDSAKGDGTGGRGLIWVNHLAPYLTRPQLERTLLKDFPTGDPWQAVLDGEFSNSLWVCAGLNKTELDKIKAATPDVIGGIGYNVYPASRSGNIGTPNANWGGVRALVPMNTITYPSKRALFASSYDWHLAGTGPRAYDRFGNGRALMVFFDGHVETVEKSEFNRAVDSPEKN